MKFRRHPDIARPDCPECACDKTAVRLRLTDVHRTAFHGTLAYFRCPACRCRFVVSIIAGKAFEPELASL